jgi:hypothetical protein
MIYTFHNVQHLITVYTVIIIWKPKHVKAIYSKNGAPCGNKFKDLFTLNIHN